MAFVSKLARRFISPDLINRIVNDLYGLQNGVQDVRVSKMVSLGDVEVQGTLKLAGAPSASSTARSHGLPIVINGTTYYLMISATP